MDKAQTEVAVAERLGRLYGAFQAALVTIPGMSLLGGLVGWFAAGAENAFSAVLILGIGIALVSLVLLAYYRAFGR